MGLVGVQEASINLQKALATRSYAAGSGRLADAFMPDPPKPRAFIPYDIPLRPKNAGVGRDNLARLVLPADMTEAEAERLCNVIRSLAMPS